MTLKTQMTSDLSVFFDTTEFSDTVTYTPTGGSGTSIDALIERTGDHQEPYVRGEEDATAEIWVKVSDVATFQHGDTFTFDSSVWEMDPERGEIYRDDNVRLIALVRRPP